MSGRWSFPHPCSQHTELLLFPQVWLQDGRLVGIRLQLWLHFVRLEKVFPAGACMLRMWYSTCDGDARLSRIVCRSFWVALLLNYESPNFTMLINLLVPVVVSTFWLVRPAGVLRLPFCELPCFCRVLRGQAPLIVSMGVQALSLTWHPYSVGFSVCRFCFSSGSLSFPVSLSRPRCTPGVSAVEPRQRQHAPVVRAAVAVHVAGGRRAVEDVGARPDAGPPQR